MSWRNLTPAIRHRKSHAAELGKRRGCGRGVVVEVVTGGGVGGGGGGGGGDGGGGTALH